jgi:hypothetical protein
MRDKHEILHDIYVAELEEATLHGDLEAEFELYAMEQMEKD